MKTRSILPLVSLFIAANSTVVYGDAEESLLYQPGTGDYVLTYDCGEDGGIMQTTLVPANKVAPAVESAFDVKSGGISYRYAVSMGASSRQPLMMFALDPIEQIWDIVEPPSQALLTGPTADDIRRYQESVTASSPSGWRAFHSTRMSGATRVGWSRRRTSSPFVAGSKQSGFTFSSRHLPGVSAAELEGDQGGTWGFPCESPGADSQVGQAVETLRRNNHVPRFVAAPIIKVPHPFDAVAVLTSLRSHVSQMEQWALTDTTFSSQIRGYLSEAITKLEANDTAGGAAALGKLRAALRTKYPSLDSETVAHALPPSVIPLNPVDDIRKLVTDYDRVLAARVLDFDAAYVVGQLGPVAVPPQASYECNAPGNDQICAPVTDADGTFVVRWGEKSCPKGPADQSCEIEILKYRLETSRNSQFFDAQQVYQGLAREFELRGLPPGIHYFRVNAEYRYCVRGQGLGYPPRYCETDELHWQTASDTYSQGPNKTTVDAH